MLGKGLQHVDARDEQVVALVLEAVGRLERRERPAHPFLAALGVLTHHAKLPVQESDAPRHGQHVAGHGVVTRADEGCLAAGDLEPGRLHVGVPAVALGLGEHNGALGGLPAARAVVGGRLGREGVAPAEPLGVDVVVHLVAQPRRREHLGAALGALALPLGLLGDARLDDAGVGARDALDGYLVVAGVALAQGLVLVVGPDDVLARRTVGEQRLQHMRRVATAEALDEALGRVAGSRSLSLFALARLLVDLQASSSQMRYSSGDYKTGPGQQRPPCQGEHRPRAAIHARAAG